MPTAIKAARARVPLTPLPSLADADLVRRARHGDDRAFEEIVRRYRAPLIRYSARHVGRDYAEDVTQHAFARAAVHLRDDPRPIHLRAWLYRVAHNAALNMRTRKDWSHEPLSPEIDGVPQPPELAAQRTEVREVVSGLDRLPERQRTALVLSVFEGLGYEAIAARLDTSPNSVRALLSRARSHLRRAAAALAPLPLLQSAIRKVSGAIGAAGGQGSIAAGGTVVQAKIVAVVATTVVAGAATAERATSGGEDADSRARSTAVGVVPPARAVPFNPVTAGVGSATDAQRTAAENETPPAELPEGEPVAEPPIEPVAPPAEPVAEEPPAEPPPDETVKDDTETHEPPPDGNPPPPPDGNPPPPDSATVTVGTP